MVFSLHGIYMPKIQVEGKGTFGGEEGKKLVLCLEDNSVDILHRCGGNAKCTSASHVKFEFIQIFL
jgi:ferredoxin